MNKKESEAPACLYTVVIFVISLLVAGQVPSVIGAMFVFGLSFVFLFLLGILIFDPPC